MTALMLMEKGKEVRSSPLPPHYNWSYVSSETIQLSWDVHRLAHLKLEQLKLIVLPERAEGKYETFDFQLGKAEINDLVPGTVYSVFFEPLRKGKASFLFSGALETLPAESATEKIVPVPQLYWHRRSHNSFQLVWKAEELINHGVDQIKVAAQPTTSRDSPKLSTAATADGALILDELVPSQQYEVMMEVIKENIPIFYQLVYLETRSTAQEVSTIPVDGQNPAECAKASDLSPPIWTLPSIEPTAVTTPTSGFQQPHLIGPPLMYTKSRLKMLLTTVWVKARQERMDCCVSTANTVKTY
ncbi:unnamed protein product [Hydatigera taeniaeformis]|uniref:Fibronectin type-III domain-containing protein n=1 Tax=Hydatigena taeniaeformis TaxID=6205 RepID=A0A0R3WKE8_HYDTA|nr:unnamed protein product [Hydatigera taeniaeformis]